MALHLPNERGAIVPEVIAGRRLWLAPEMQDICDKIRFGDPTLGWEGDDRLAVYWLPEVPCWEIRRLEEDGKSRFVTRSERGARLTEDAIRFLVANDTRRGAHRDLHAEVTEANRRLHETQEKERQEWITEHFAPKLRHVLMRDDHGGGQRSFTGLDKLKERLGG